MAGSESCQTLHLFEAGVDARYICRGCIMRSLCVTPEGLRAVLKEMGKHWRL